MRQPALHVMLRTAGVLAALASASGLASAQPSQAPPEQALTMPSPIGPTIPPYPEGGSGDAAVVLGLVVRADGTVQGAEVLEGSEPFASAAVSAATSWRFEPARRGGQPINARIRFRVVFRAPVTPVTPVIPAPPPAPPPIPQPPSPPVTQASPDAPQNGARPPSSPAHEEGIEVMVQGQRMAPMTRSMSREEVRQMPGAFGDPFRAIEAMPGVTPIASGVPYFFVRGAPPGNVGYFVDGVRVPLLYHVALGPSVIHPALVDRVDLYPGGYPARFGRFTGGIIAGETKEPELRFHGEGNVRLFDAGAMVEAPFDGGRGSALVAGRYAYPGALMKIFSPGVELGYWDYQARVTYDLTPSDRIGVFAFGSHDYLAEIEDDGETDVVVAGDFHRVDLRYDKSLAGGARLRQAVTLGYDESAARGEQQAGTSWLVGSRVELTMPVSESVTVRAGADAQLERYDINVTENDDDYPSLNDQALARLLTSREDLAAGVWADAVLRVTPEFEIIPGLRGDIFGSDGAAQATLDPRLATRLEVTPRVALLSAIGVTHQPPSFLGAAPAMQIGGLRGGVQTGLLASSGVEVVLPADVTATVTGFRSAFFNLSDMLGNRPPRSDIGLARQAELRSLGSTYGVEVHVRRSLSKRLGGFLSYTLSRSLRHLGRETFDSAYDRRHVLNLAAGYDLGRNWKLGGRMVFYSGIPMTIDYDWRRRRSTNGQGNTGGNNDGPREPDTLEDILRREAQRALVAEYVRSLNLPERLPAFFRVDLRLEKRWVWGEGRWMALTFEVLNATAGKEVLQYECSIESGCVPEELGPIVIPSIGLEAGF